MKIVPIKYDSNNKQKILILYTGGTIGMDYTNCGLKVIPGLFSSQLKELSPTNDLSIDLIEYDNLIDSSDIQIEDWQQIINHIAEFYDEYDGFVIIHGTDTMAYTASMLSFALRGLDKPVIITGAQLPLVHRRSDGWTNIIDALFSASQSDLHEVAITFNNKLFRGCRAQKISTNRFIAFDSVDEEPLAEFGIEIEWHKKRWLKSSGYSFTPILPQKFNIIDLVLRPGYTTDFIADVLENNHDLHGVILQTYGSGTIPMKHQKLVNAIKSACDRGVVVISITQVNEGTVSHDYANSQLGGLGVINGKDMTPEAALAKLTILLSAKMNLNNIKKSIFKNLVGELTEKI